MILLSVVTIDCFAETFCVKTSSELKSALSIAGTNGQSDLIKISKGNYNSGLDSYIYSGFNDFDLEISGGWSAFMGHSCTLQLSLEPFSTIIDGNNHHGGLIITPSSSSDITISNLFFINGFTANRGGGIYINSPQSYMGNVELTHNAFFNNTANYGGAIYASANKLTVTNNSFISNHSLGESAIILISSAATGIYFINNTVLSNTTDNTSMSTAAGLTIIVIGTSKILIANNVFADNDINQFDLQGDGFKYVRNNNIVGTTFGVTADSESGNFSTPPNFATTVNLDYFIPSFNSPLVNAGIEIPDVIPFPPPFIWGWVAPSTDIRDQIRIQGGKIDVGAFESAPPKDLIFMNGFEEITP